MREPRYTGITIVDGPLGSGKTYYACRRIADALWNRRPVTTNVQLVPDFGYRIAALHIGGRNAEVRRRKAAFEMACHYHYSDDVIDVLEKEMREPIVENKGLMVIDEAHARLNNRLFREEGRGEVIERIRQLRKLGWEVLFVSQHVESLDKQVRDALTYQLKLVNWRRRYWWFPFDLFLALRFFAGDRTTGKGVKPMQRDLYRLNKKVAGLYDTMALHGAVLAKGKPPDDELLPYRSPRGRAQLASTASGDEGDAGERAA